MVCGVSREVGDAQGRQEAAVKTERERERVELVERE